MPRITAYYPMMTADTEELAHDRPFEITCRPQDSSFYPHLYLLSFGRQYIPDLNIAMTPEQMLRLIDVLNVALRGHVSGGVGETECQDTTSTTSN